MSKTWRRKAKRGTFHATLRLIVAAILTSVCAGTAAVILDSLSPRIPNALAQSAAPPPAPAQPTRFSHPLNIGAELSFAILQDRDGFMWIGTAASGLIRYDGYAPQFFTAGAQSVSSNAIFALLEDRDGLLWMGTRGGGLNKYDKQTNTFTAYRHEPANDNSLSSDSVNPAAQLLVEDRDGMIWIGTDAGLDRFDKRTGNFTHYRHDAARPGSLSSNNILAVLEDSEGFIWVGTDTGLDRLDPRTGDITHYRHAATDDRTLGAASVLALRETRDGLLWIGGPQVLDRFDQRTGVFTHYRHNPNDPASLPSMTVASIYETPTGELFLGALADPVGLVQFDRATETFTIDKHDPADPQSLSGDMIRQVFEDRSGIRWIVHGPGMVDQYDPQRQRFTLWQANPNNPNSLSNSIVVGVLEDQTGIFWIATVGGLNRYDPQTQTFTHYLNDPADPTSLSNPFAIALLEDRAGNFWVSTFGDLCRFDRAEGRCSQQVPISSIYGMIEDSAHPGQLWLGTFNQGFYKYDVATGQFKQYANDPADPASLANNTTWVLKEDKADPNILWIPTQGGGLDRFDKTTETFTHYRHNPDDPASIGANQVFDVYEDQAGNFWVATGGGGLNKFDETAGTFQRYNKDNHFPTNEVRTILEDAAGQLWLGSDIGLLKFDPRTGHAKVYDAGDGLQGNSFLPIARYKTRAGEMWFGGVNGVNRFFPEQISDNPFVPPIHFTALSQDGEPLVLGTAPERLTSITLKWPDNYFEFEYVALNYTQSEKNQYAYQLEGIDNDWYAAGTRRFGRYANLPGGTYTLRVKGSNNDGLWNENGASLSVTIIPPFWDTSGFRILIAVSATGLIAGGFRYRTRSLRRRAQQLEREVAARTHELTETNRQLEIARDAAQAAQHAAEAANQAKSVFLANMSHELRTPLNAVLGYAQLLQRQTLNPEFKQAVNIIQQSGEHLLVLINDVLNIAQIEAGKLEIHASAVGLPAFLEDIVGIIRARAELKRLDVIYEPLTELPAGVWADETRLRQVLLNLLGNAVKFTDQGQVTLRVSATYLEAPLVRLHFEVVDTGVGIAPDQVGNIFLPFVQVGSQQRRIEGTGLGLTISRELIQSMGGDIQVASEPGKGSAFWFDLILPIISVSTRARPHAEPHLSGYAGPRRKVLVVDDNTNNRQVLISLLEPLGFELHEVDNGQAAIEQADAWRPDLILMDMFLPTLTGFEATRAIRQQAASAAPIIIGVSASVTELDMQHILAAGCNAALPKPVNVNQLLGLIEAHLNLTWIYAPPAESHLEAPEIAPALVLPSASELAALYELARRGNLQGIQTRVAELEQADEQLAPFADQLRQLAQRFEDQALIVLIHQYLEQS